MSLEDTLLKSHEDSLADLQKLRENIEHCRLMIRAITQGVVQGTETITSDGVLYSMPRHVWDAITDAAQGIK